MANKREACVDSNVHQKKTAPVVEERYLDGLLHCLGCSRDNTSDDPRCNDCVCGSLFEASKPALDPGYVHPKKIRKGGTNG